MDQREIDERLQQIQDEISAAEKLLILRAVGLFAIGAALGTVAYYL